MLRLLTPTILLLLCAGCGESASGDGVGGVSASEAKALNEAADMLDRRATVPTAAPAPGLNPAAKRAAQAEKK